LQQSGLGAAPEATRERLNAIQQKMDERQRILELPQRFAGSKQLSRREMEIENALFQGTDRHSFLRALYHQGVPPPLLFSWPCNRAEMVWQGIPWDAVEPRGAERPLCSPPQRRRK